MNTNEESRIHRLLAAGPEWRPDANRGLALLREQRAAGKARRRGWVLTGCMAAVVSIPLVAFPATRALAAHCVSACVTETSAVRAFLLGVTTAGLTSRTYIRPEERKLAPDFTLDDVSGHAITLSALRGKVVLLNFWATWCPPCGQEIPWFIEFQQSLREQGLTVLGVSMDRGGWNLVKPYIEARHVNYSVVIADENVARLFGGLKSIPLTLIIDTSGRIAAIHAGLCRKDEYQTDIGLILNEKGL